jgi:hypothetical protein
VYPKLTPRKRVPCIVHNGIVVVRQSKRVDLFISQLVEVILLSGHDVHLLNGDMVLSIRSCMLVPESNHMAQLMDNNAEFVCKENSL